MGDGVGVVDAVGVAERDGVVDGVALRVGVADGVSVPVGDGDAPPAGVGDTDAAGAVMTRRPWFSEMYSRPHVNAMPFGSRNVASARVPSR